MKGSRLFAVLVMALIAPAAAQVMSVPVITPPAGIETVDPSVAQREIVRLRQEKLEAEEKLKEALDRIDQMTSRGGSLVRAYCSDATTSRNTAGAEESCGNYTCHNVSGLCNRTATSTSECAPGYLWDTGSQCVPAPTSPAEDD